MNPEISKSILKLLFFISQITFQLMKIIFPKQLPETMLIYHGHGTLVFIGGHCYQKCGACCSSCYHFQPILLIVVMVISLAMEQSYDPIYIRNTISSFSIQTLYCIIQFGMMDRAQDGSRRHHSFCICMQRQHIQVITSIMKWRWNYLSIPKRQWCSRLEKD